MKYLHAMVRVSNLDKSLAFYKDALGLIETRRKDYPEGKYTLVFLAAPENPEAEVELTFNYDVEDYGGARNFGHLAFEVDDVYAACARLQQHGVTVNRPPRYGSMSFVRSPYNISIELLQRGDPQPPQEPLLSMPNTGKW